MLVLEISLHVTRRSVITGVLSLIIGLGFLIFAYTARKSAAPEGQPGGIEYQITKIEDFKGFEYDGFYWSDDHFVKKTN